MILASIPIKNSNDKAIHSINSEKDSLNWDPKIHPYKPKIKFNYIMKKKNRTGDHQWYITDNSKFKKHFKNWKLKYNIQKIYKEMIEAEKLKFYDNK